MIQSFYTGVTGMKAFQDGLSVTSNNLANAQTIGYKKQKAIFNDLLYKNSTGSQASNGYAGTNPTSIGSGSRMTGTSTDYTGGSLTFTNGKTDAAIDGSGFFILGDETATTLEYTRKGTFGLSEDGYLVNDEGKYVLAYPATAGVVNGPVDTDDKPERIQIKMGEDGEANAAGSKPKDYAITDNGYVMVQYEDGTFQPIGQLGVATFPNEKGLMKTGNGNYIVAPASGDPAYSLSGENGAGKIRGGTTEASNVDLSAEFVDLMLYQKGFQGNSKAVKVSDDVLNDVINLIR